MFYSDSMQHSFDFLALDMAKWAATLQPLLHGIDRIPRRTPLRQLVKSMISSRTVDAVSRDAFERLMHAYPDGAGLAEAAPDTVEEIIADVTFPADKARNLPLAMQRILERTGGLDLDFLRSLPVAEALRWLEDLPGVGRQVAAATLNTSLLSRPVLVVDTHMLRVLQRLGAVRPNATPQAASETVTAALPGWSGDDFFHFHIMGKRLGQRVCRAGEPQCHACPLSADCRTGRERSPAPARELELSA